MALAAWLAFLYDLLVGATPVTVSHAIANGFAVLHLEQRAGIAFERPLNAFLAGQPFLKQIASYYYDNAHFVVTFGLLALLWWRSPSRYRPLRTTLVLTNLIAFFVFYLYPMAPPRLLPGAAFHDIVAESEAIGNWHRGALANCADQYAAMPSLHLAWAVWSAAAAFALTRRKGVRAAAVLYPFVTALDVLATANHFLIDCLAGVATVALAWALRDVVCALAAVAFRRREERTAAFSVCWVGTRPAKRGPAASGVRLRRVDSLEVEMQNNKDAITTDRQALLGAGPGGEVPAWQR